MKKKLKLKDGWYKYGGTLVKIITATQTSEVVHGIIWVYRKHITRTMLSISSSDLHELTDSDRMRLSLRLLNSKEVIEE